MRITKKYNLIKKVLGTKRRENKILFSNQSHADAILQEIISSKEEILSTSIKKPLLLKFVSNIYFECLSKRRENKQIPFHVILYEYFLNKYGLKKTVEKKLKQVFFNNFCFQ